MKLETYEKAKEIRESIEKLEWIQVDDAIALVGLNEEGKYTGEARSTIINKELKKTVANMIDGLEKEFEYLQDSNVDESYKCDVQDEEEDKFEIERRKIEDELLKLGGTRDFWSIGDDDTEKCRMMYAYDDNKLWLTYTSVVQELGQIYFPSEEQAQKAIDTIGEDRIKKYMFYVHD